MPAPATNDEFVDLVVKSGVVEDTKLHSHLDKLRTSGKLPPDPSKLAGVLVRDGVLTYFQADQILQGKWKRFSIGKYRVLEKLGTGGMGQVFLCEHKFMKRRVAVKVLPAAKASDPASLERFYREARAVAALDHPNIVRAYDIDQDNGLHFIVMEYVDGTNLQDLVKKVGPLDPTRACHYVYGSAVGLQHAHEMGLVHRDIKPGNILVDRAGVVKILDMGLAKFFHDEDDKLTKKYDENILGTADYLAPEQALDSTMVDIRADIYSLGATFYFMLTGQPPFTEGTVTQKLLWHQTREPVPVRSLRPDVPQDLADLLAKIMAKEPAARFQTPAELMTALTPWVMTPIAPPSDRELPNLSRAAGQGSSTISANRGITPAPPTPAPTVVASAATSAPTAVAPHLHPTTESVIQIDSPLGQPEAPATPPVGSVTSSGLYPGAKLSHPINLAPPPGFEDQAENDAEPATEGETTQPWQTDGEQEPTEAPVDAFWGSVSEDADSAPVPNAAAASSPQPKATATPPSSSRRGLLIGVIAGGSLLVALAGVAFVLLTGGSDTPLEGDAAKTWYVAKSGEGPVKSRTLTTLRGAIEQVKSGEKIIILDDELSEPPVTLMGRRGAQKLNDITIEAGNTGRRVVWTPNLSGAIRQNAVLEIIDVEAAMISGLTIDCGGKMPVGLGVGQASPGTVIDGVIVKNPNKIGFLGYSLKGDPGRPVRFTNLVCIAGQKIDAGLVLDGSRGSVKDVVIEGVRLQGPGESGIGLRGGITTTEIKNCRIFDFTSGVNITNLPPPTNDYDVTIAQNTLFQMTAGILIDGDIKPPKRQLSLTRNYFGRVKEIVSSKTPQPGVKGTDNARDKATLDGKLATKATLISDFELSGTQSAADSDFLSLSASAKAAEYGPKP